MAKCAMYIIVIFLSPKLSVHNYCPKFYSGLGYVLHSLACRTHNAYNKTNIFLIFARYPFYVDNYVSPQLTLIVPLSSVICFFFCFIFIHYNMCALNFLGRLSSNISENFINCFLRFVRLKSTVLEILKYILRALKAKECFCKLVFFAWCTHPGN